MSWLRIHHGDMLWPIGGGLVGLSGLLVLIGLWSYGEHKASARAAFARTHIRFSPPTYELAGASSHTGQQQAEQEDSSGSDQNSGTARADALQSYAAGVLARINRAKRFPEEELALGHSALVSVMVQINNQGQVQHMQIIAPSAHASFNQAAADAVRNSGPHPPFPPEIKQSRMQLRVQLRFIASP